MLNFQTFGTWVIWRKSRKQRELPNGHQTNFEDKSGISATGSHYSPVSGYYRESTIQSAIGAGHGTERLVVGRGGEVYYSRTKMVTS